MNEMKKRGPDRHSSLLVTVKTQIRSNSSITIARDSIEEQRSTYEKKLSVTTDWLSMVELRPAFN